MRFAWTAGIALMVGIPQWSAADASSGQDTASLYLRPLATPVTVHQTAELLGGGVAGAGLGSSVAVDGNTVVVGAPSEGSKEGAAYVFVNVHSTWIQQTRLVPPDGAAGDNFGSSVSIAGSSIVVGAPGHSSLKGSAYVFTRSGSAWKETAELAGTGAAANDTFGHSVSVSGSTIAVGAPGHSGGGAVYMFHASGRKWTQTGALSASAGNQFGSSVAVSGSFLIVGSIGTSGTGGAYVFAQSGTAWRQVGNVLTPSDGHYGDQFGEAVALSGTVAAVGSATHSYVFDGSSGDWNHQTELTATGAPEFWGLSVAVSGSTVVIGSSLGYYPAFVFIRSHGRWTLSAKLSGAGTSFSTKYGSAVGISGGVVVVGDPAQNPGGGPNAGAAYTFAAKGATWTGGAELSSRSGAALAGDSVAVSGPSALVGAPGENQYAGAALLFGGSQGWSLATGFEASDGATADELGLLNVAVSGNTVVVGAPHKNTLTGAAYVYVKTNGTWAQQAKLIGSDTSMFDQFGLGVAVAGNTIVVGAPDHGSGAAYVFTRSGASWTQRKELTVPGASGFGSSVAMSGSSTVIIGAGAGAYVFIGLGGSWTLQGTLAGSGISAVAISGAIAVVGASSFDSVYVFALLKGKWSREAVLKPLVGSAGDKFGMSVGVSGSTVVVGAPARANLTGAAYVFQRAGQRWVETDILAASDGATNSEFGFSVAISGSTAVAGAPEAASFSGAAYVFSIPPYKPPTSVSSVQFQPQNR